MYLPRGTFREGAKAMRNPSPTFAGCMVWVFAPLGLLWAATGIGLFVSSVGSEPPKPKGERAVVAEQQTVAVRFGDPVVLASIAVRPMLRRDGYTARGDLCHNEVVGSTKLQVNVAGEPVKLKLDSWRQVRGKRQQWPIRDVNETGFAPLNCKFGSEGGVAEVLALRPGEQVELMRGPFPTITKGWTALGSGNKRRVGRAIGAFVVVVMGVLCILAARFYLRRWRAGCNQPAA